MIKHLPSNMTFLCIHLMSKYIYNNQLWEVFTHLWAADQELSWQPCLTLHTCFQGMHGATPTELQAVYSWPIPQNGQEVHQFLGFASTISTVSTVLQILQHIFMLWHSKLLHFESKGCFVLLKPSMHRHFFHPQKLLVPGISPRIPSIQLHYQWVCATNWCKWSETRCKLLQGNTLVRKFRAI